MDQGGRGHEGRMRGGKGADSTRRGTRLREGIGDQGYGGSGRKGTRRKDERGNRSR